MESIETPVEGQHSWRFTCSKLKFLSRITSARSYLFWLCWAGACQSLLVNGLINVSISTIEKRYELTSTDSGLIVGAYDIASFIFVLPISYLGGQIGTCKPRWVAFGSILLAIGSFMYSLPHFATGLYQALEDQSDMSYCPAVSSPFSSNETISKVIRSNHAHTEHLQNFKYLFFGAQLIMGIGAAPLYTLGITFLDENVSNELQPVYTGIFYASTTIGPALGFTLGGQLLRVYVDFFTISADQVGLTPSSSAWVGAWWIGFIASGVLLLSAALPLLAFPSKLEGSKKNENFNSISQTLSGEPAALNDDNFVVNTNDSDDQEALSLKDILKEIPGAVKKLAQNYTFLLISLEESCETVLLAGLGAFLPKIIESQFVLSSSTSALIVGGLVVPCGCGGAFVGGYIIKYYQMDCRDILKLSVFLVGMSFCFCFTFLISCPNPEFAGVSTPYSESNYDVNIHGALSLNSSCNSNCSCSRDNYNPICGTDNILYYSPCYAGCGKIYGSGRTEAYSNCSCIRTQVRSHVTIEGELKEVMAIRKKCKSTCNSIYGFTAMLFIFLIFTLMNSMPCLSATLRCTDEKHRTFALGTQMIIWRMLGSIPGPLVFGLVIDDACLLWQTTGGAVGSCLIYDNYSFSRAMIGLAFLGKGSAFIFAVLAWWTYPPTPDSKEQPPTLPPSDTNEMYVYDNAVLDSS